MSVKLLTEHNLEFLSLKGGCTGSSESTLVKMSNCWKSYAAAPFIVFSDLRYWYDYGVMFPELLSAFIALEPCKRENGCLQVKVIHICITNLQQSCW